MCGNYVGDCVGGCGNPYYGYQGYYAQNPQMAEQVQDYQYADVAPKRAVFARLAIGGSRSGIAERLKDPKDARLVVLRNEDSHDAVVATHGFNCLASNSFPVFLCSVFGHDDVARPNFCSFSYLLFQRDRLDGQYYKFF